MQTPSMAACHVMSRNQHDEEHSETVPKAEAEAGSMAETVRSTFELLVPVAPEFAADFYELLLKDNSEMMWVFKDTHMATQHTKLLEALVKLVDNIENPVPLVEVIAMKHRHFGLRPHHFEFVGQALVAALGKHLEPHGRWTKVEQSAWLAVYGLIAQTMQDVLARVDKNVAIPSPILGSPIQTSNESLLLKRESKWGHEFVPDEEEPTAAEEMFPEFRRRSTRKSLRRKNTRGASMKRSTKKCDVADKAHFVAVDP